MTSSQKGILFALLSAGFFAAEAALAKLAVADFHILQILFFRQAVVMASALPSYAAHLPSQLSTRQPLLHLLRLSAAFAALASGIWAVSVLPLTTAVTLGFAKVFFILLIAFRFLGEPVGPHRLGAVAVGFLGVLIVLRPGVDGFVDPNALIPLGSAFAAAVAYSCVRRLSQTESTATLLVYQAVFIGGAAGLAMFWLWRTPSLNGLLLLGFIGVLAAVGQWAAVQGVRMAEASVAGNAEYSKLIWAAGIGYLLFAETPDLTTIIGAAVIIAAALYIFRRERIRRGLR